MTTKAHRSHGLHQPNRGMKKPPEFRRVRCITSAGGVPFNRSQADVAAQGVHQTSKNVDKAAVEWHARSAVRLPHLRKFQEFERSPRSAVSFRCPMSGRLPGNE